MLESCYTRERDRGREREDNTFSLRSNVVGSQAATPTECPEKKSFLEGDGTETHEKSGESCFAETPTPKLGGGSKACENAEIAEKDGKQSRQKPKRGEEYDSDFAMLWFDFPESKNSSKIKAFSAWKRLNQRDRRACYLGAIEYRAQIEAGKFWEGYTPTHLSTFINQRKWEAWIDALARGESLAFTQQEMEGWNGSVFTSH